MGFIGLKVTESKQVAKPELFSFQESKEERREEPTNKLERPSKELFSLTPHKKSNLEKMLGI